MKTFTSLLTSFPNNSLTIILTSWLPTHKYQNTISISYVCIIIRVVIWLIRDRTHTWAPESNRMTDPFLLFSFWLLPLLTSHLYIPIWTPKIYKCRMNKRWKEKKSSSCNKKRKSSQSLVGIIIIISFDSCHCILLYWYLEGKRVLLDEF